MYKYFTSPVRHSTVSFLAECASAALLPQCSMAYSTVMAYRRHRARSDMGGDGACRLLTAASDLRTSTVQYE